VSADERPGPFLALAGPTGVGKTERSLALAGALGAEIVSADSRQVFRRLDVGTAKPDPEARARVRHHFVDELDPGEPWSAGRFARAAEERIAGILARGCVPLVVGGSTLYLDALLHGLADVPAAPPELRAELGREAATAEGRARLVEELARADPAAAAAIDAANPRRLVRALEVLRATGRPASSFLAAAPLPAYRWRVVVLTRPRADLYARIDARVDAMLAAGLVEENRRLLGAGLRPDTDPLRTIGYREPMAYLREEVGYEEMVRLLKQNTRRYAKRQLTWFRRWPHAMWVDLFQ
jgi:tRNA dimethylallyltransferase